MTIVHNYLLVIDYIAAQIIFKFNLTDRNTMISALRTAVSLWRKGPYVRPSKQILQVRNMFCIGSTQTGCRRSDHPMERKFSQDLRRPI